MASKRWKGGAAATADVWTLTIGGTPASGNTYTATIGYRSITYKASGTDTNDTIAAALQALLSGAPGNTYGEFLEYTWTVSNNVITATSNYPGIPGVISGSATGTGTPTVTAVNTIPSIGPNDASVPINYDAGSLPVAGDTLNIDHTAVDILWNLQILNGVAIALLNIDSTFQSGTGGNGTIGLPEINTNATEYVEYRQQSLQCAPATAIVGDGQGNGSGRIKLDFGTAVTALIVHGTGSPIDAELPALIIKGGAAGSTASVNGGSVGFDVFGGTTSTWTTLNTAAGSNGAPQVYCGTGCTVTTLNQDDGTVLMETAPATINQEGGTLTVMAGNVTTWNAYGGTPAYLGTGTIATLNSYVTVDFSQDPRARTVTNATFYAGGGFNDPGATVAWSNAFVVQADSSQVTLNWGRNRHVALV